MTTTSLLLSGEDYRQLRRHLLPGDARCEEAAFLFAELQGRELLVREWRPVAAEEFAYQSAYYIELTDQARAAAIKRAHDQSACLIEAHSHPYQEKARFSPSDRAGFLEFVPHVLWRLKQRPYTALVFAPDSFDALAWFTDVQEPCGLDVRLTDGSIVSPTGTSLANWGSEERWHE